jgi:nitroimidazol reductase NimA-like FMN-containing flavoprotein (pyridoxamine 5'-phosphate oxidase superfamily)
MTDQHVLEVINDPVSQRLINSNIPARLAYNGVDGFPRVIPVGFHWDGAQFLIGSPDNAPKVKALRKRPQVALTIDTEGMPPNVLLVRGVASVEVVDGVHEAFLDASRKRISPEDWPEWEAGVRGLYRKMALIAIEPQWAKVLDFETRLPQPVEQLIKEATGQHVRPS